MPHIIFWVEAVLTSIYHISLLPTPTLNWETPHSRLYGSPPSYSSLRVFGCSCFPHLRSYVSNKLSSHSIECIFLGYSSQHKGYRCLDPTTGRVYISRQVIFNKTVFPCKQLQAQKSYDTGPLEFTLLSNPEPNLPQSATSGPSPFIENDNSPSPPIQPYSVSPPEPCEEGVHLLIPSLPPQSSTSVSTDAPILTYQRRHSIISNNS